MPDITGVIKYPASTRPIPKRWSINAALEILNVQWPDIRRHVNSSTYFYTYGNGGVAPRGKLSFWGRNEGHLSELAYEVKKAYHRMLLEIRSDFTENHEQAIKVNEAFSYIKRQLFYRGVNL